MALIDPAICASATRGFEFWSTTGGAVSIDATVKRKGNQCSFKLDSGAGPTAAFLRINGKMADAGRRLTFWMYFPALPASGGIEFASVRTSANVRVMQLIILSTGKFRITPTGCPNVTGTITLETNRWYCIGLSYTITSSTSFEIRGYVDGVLDVSISSNGTLTNVGSSVFRIDTLIAEANWVIYADEIAIDDTADLSSPGLRGVADKKPARNGDENLWDTAIGDNATNRFQNVNNRPIDEASGWREAGITSNREVFYLETAAQGANYIAGMVVVGHTGWCWAKTEANPGVGTPRLIHEDGGVLLSLTTSPALYTETITTATYPTSGSAIGMEANGGTEDTFFYDCGINIVYIDQVVCAVGGQGPVQRSYRPAPYRPGIAR